MELKVIISIRISLGFLDFAKSFDGLGFGIETGRRGR